MHSAAYRDTLQQGYKSLQCTLKTIPIFSTLRRDDGFVRQYFLNLKC